MLILFEGIDGVGKGTQIELLKKELDATVFKYPTSKTPALNDFLEKKVSMDQRTVFHLFLKDIKNEQNEVKNTNGIVILDRYVLSTIAYEKDGITDTEAKKAVLEMKFLKPDFVILLDLDPKTSQERKKRQKELDRYEANVTYLQKVRENFLQLYKERFLTPSWHKIDASQSISDVHMQIMEIIRTEIGKQHSQK